LLDSLTVSHPQGALTLSPAFDAMGATFATRMRFDASVIISATSLAPDASITVSGSGFTNAPLPHTMVQSASYEGLTVRLSFGGVTRLCAVNVKREFPMQTSFKSLSNGGLRSGANAGAAITISNDGNVLVVGLPGANQAELFLRSGALWQGPFLLALNAIQMAVSPIDMGDEFGRSVATNEDGTLIAVGAPGDDAAMNGVANSGAVYVFRRTGITITLVNQLKGPTVRAEDTFGTSVAMTGNGFTLLVGVPGDDSVADGGTAIGPTNSGAAVVFADNGGVFAPVRNLKAPNAGVDDAFGTSVAIANDNWGCGGGIVCNGNCAPASPPCPQTQGLRYVVGAPLEDSSSPTASTSSGSNELSANSGAVYVFSGTPFTATLSAYLKRPTPQASAFFGTSVAISRRWGSIAVGAPRDASGAVGIAASIGDITMAASNGSMPGAGSVTIFEPSFVIARYVKFDEPQPNDNLGASVALGADQYVVVAGAPGVNGATGAALLSVLTSSPRPLLVLPPFPDTNDEFGASVAVFGFNLAFVGSPGEDSVAGGLNSGAGLAVNTLSNSGAVFLHVD